MAIRHVNLGRQRRRAKRPLTAGVEVQRAAPDVCAGSHNKYNKKLPTNVLIAKHVLLVLIVAGVSLLLFTNLYLY